MTEKEKAAAGYLYDANYDQEIIESRTACMDTVSYTHLELWFMGSHPYRNGMIMMDTWTKYYKVSICLITAISYIADESSC